MSLARRTRLAALLAAFSVGTAGVTAWAYGHETEHPHIPPRR